VRAVVQRVQGPGGEDGSFVAIWAAKAGDNELPLAHDPSRVTYHLRRSFLGGSLDELLANKSFQKLSVAFADPEHALPQPELVPANRVRGESRYSSSFRFSTIPSANHSTEGCAGTGWLMGQRPPECSWSPCHLSPKLPFDHRRLQRRRYQRCMITNNFENDFM
jgi:hypothetical protein